MPHSPMRLTTDRATASAAASSRPGRRSANSSPPSRNASPPWRSRVDTCASTRSPAGWPCWSLIRLKSSTSRRQTDTSPSALLGASQLTLQPLLEVAVVAEAGQRVGERETHRLQRAVRRALVQRDRRERPDERGDQVRRALPQHDEHQRGRRHQRERQRERARVRDDELRVADRRAGRGDRRADQHEVDGEEDHRRHRDARQDAHGRRVVSGTASVPNLPGRPSARTRRR